jgi:Tol biopolymer transport system component
MFALPHRSPLPAIVALVILFTGFAVQRADAAPAVVRIAPAGTDPNGPSAYPSLSATGRFIAFGSIASNLGPSVGIGRTPNIYRQDLLTGTIEVLSSGSGAPADGPSTTPSISGDGSAVAFASRAGNLVAGDSNQKPDIFVRVVGGPIVLITRTPGGQLTTGASYQPTISADGRHVAFSSTADDLVFGDDNASSDVFVSDLLTGAIQRVSVSGRHRQANGPSSNPAISADGRFVSFTSAASNLVPRDRNDHTDVFRHDMATGRTVLVSRRSSGAPGDNDSFAPAVSADGNRVVFQSSAENLAEPWAPGPNVYVRDIARRRTSIADVAVGGGPRSAELDPSLLQQAAISDTGELVAFESGADNLIGGDDNGADDLFVTFVASPNA